MRVFITGIAGFIGSTLAENLFREGHEVIGIDNLYTGDAANVPEGISWERRDIAGEDSFSVFNGKFDAVVHLAAQTSGEKSFDVPFYDLNTNMLGTANVYRFALEREAGVMVNMSSMSAYGDVPFRKVVDESWPAKPVSLYGNTKLAAERMLELLSEKDGMPVVSMRLFNAYGPKQNLRELKQGMVSIFLAQFLKHEKVIVKGSFDRVRDLVYIDDIVSVLKAVLENPRSGVYNLSTGKLTSVGELTRMIKEISGIDKEVVSEGYTSGDIMGFAGNNRKLKDVFGMEAATGIEDGLRKMISYYTRRNLK